MPTALQQAATRAAAEIYRLANNSDLQRMLDIASEVRSDRIDLTNDLSDRVFRVWTSAATTIGALADSALASGLSPAAARRSIAPLIRNVVNAASDDTRDLIIQAWSEGGAAGIAGITDMLEQLGKTVEDFSPSDTNFLNNLLRDVATNARRAIPEYVAAVTSPEAAKNIAAISADLARRARAGVSVAATRAHEQAAQTALEQTRTRKMWITSFSANTCGTCAALHGTVLPAAGNFSAKRSFQSAPDVYGDLSTPPRHPHCHCILIPFTAPMTRQRGPSISSLKAFAIAYAVQRGWQELHQEDQPTSSDTSEDSEADT